jgi:hypothetical protein
MITENENMNHGNMKMSIDIPFYKLICNVSLLWKINYGLFAMLAYYGNMYYFKLGLIVEK